VRAHVLRHSQDGARQVATNALASRPRSLFAPPPAPASDAGLCKESCVPAERAELAEREVVNVVLSMFDEFESCWTVRALVLAVVQPAAWQRVTRLCVRVRAKGALC
jgi:hypothetical protein